MRPVQTLKLDASEQRQVRVEDVAIARGNDVPQMSGGRPVAGEGWPGTSTGLR